MPIKKIEIHGLNPEHPLAQVINEINDNLDAVIDAINSIDAETGVVGATGAKGDKGDPGQQGIEGPAGKDGKDGRNGIDGQQGPAGQDGKDGKDGQPGRDGLPGRDGVDGKDGKDGLPGEQGPKGEKGEPGIQGLPGKDGKDGLPGTAGKDGLPGTAGPQGVAGPAGKDGVSITSAVVNSTGNLIITKSDGTTVDAGKVSATTTTTTTTTTSGPPVVGGAVNPFAPSTPVATSTKGYAAAYVDAGTFVQLDNLKFTVTTGGQRGLTCATVTGTATLAISASFAMINGGYAGNATNWSINPTYTTTANMTGSWFGWSFPNAGDASTYNIQEVSTKNFYRVTLMIGPAYNKNFISIERLY